MKIKIIDLQAKIKELERATTKDNLSSFYEWELERHSVEYEVEFLKNEKKILESKIEELEKEVTRLFQKNSTATEIDLQREIEGLEGKVSNLSEGLAFYVEENKQLKAKLSAAEKLEPICCSLVDAWKSLIHIITSRLHYHDLVFEVSCVICQDINVSCKNVKIAEQAIQAYQALKECEK